MSSKFEKQDWPAVLYYHAITSEIPRAYLNFIGKKLINFFRTIYGLTAFTLITIGVLFKKARYARGVILPATCIQVYRAGIRPLPMCSFLMLALGFVIVGQVVSILTRVGAQSMVGSIMVMVLVRELGPIIASILVLARVGTAIVIELGTSRALGEIEALESLGIDPIHYLVIPRFIGLAVSNFALTIYLILGTLFSGYMFAFLQDVPLQPGAYIDQIASALQLKDFVTLGLKTALFGAITAIATCYEGLARPLSLEEVPVATTKAVIDCVALWSLVDGVFLVVYLI